jgi:hypothetical protein
VANFVGESWAVTDPLGRYDASNPDNSVGLHWVEGTSVIELNQLKSRYYAPGLLQRILDGERGSAADAVSYEASRYGEGLLTYSLLQGMRGASLDEGSRLEVTHWFRYASEQVPELAQSVGGIQRPEIAAPKGTGFPIALLALEDRQKIPIVSVKPQLLRVICLDKQDLDSFGLCEAVRERLRDISHPDGRGAGAIEAPVIYFDAGVDDLPGALRPQLVYNVSGNSITVHVRLILDEKVISEQTLSASASDKAALTVQVCERILAMANEQK